MGARGDERLKRYVMRAPCRRTFLQTSGFLCRMLVGCQGVGWFLGTASIPWPCMSVFMAAPGCLGPCGLAVQFDSRYRDPPTLCCFPWWLLLCVASCGSTQIFEVCVLVLGNMSLRSW